MNNKVKDDGNVENDDDTDDNSGPNLEYDYANSIKDVKIVYNSYDDNKFVDDDGYKDKKEQAENNQPLP